MLALFWPQSSASLHKLNTLYHLTQLIPLTVNTKCIKEKLHVTKNKDWKPNARHAAS